MSTPTLPSDITLDVGAHDKLGDGACAMEMVDYMFRVSQGAKLSKRSKLSDHPECTCPVIAAFMRAWNDALPDADRTRLLAPLLLDAIGTRGTEEDAQRRAWMATDWLTRVYAPAFLELAGLSDFARQLRELKALLSTEAATVAQPTIDAARAAAWAAARAAASDAARAAASDAARAAAKEKLAPVVAELQASAQQLVRDMCAVTKGRAET
jgi:hypothetical protein